MSRFKQSARAYLRHTGDLYGAGFQYTDPDRNVIQLGPWKGIKPGGTLDLTPEYLLDLQDGELVDGAIYPIWTKPAQSAGQTLPFFADQIFISYAGHTLLLYGDATNVYAIQNLTTGNSDVSAVAITSTQPNFVQWGQYIYIATGDSLLRFDVIARTFLNIADGLDLVRLAIIDNNLVGISADTIYWSVDGDPEDFAGIGSGSNSPFIGSLFGIIASDSSNGYVLGSQGIIQISATGSAEPAFRFVKIEAPGTLSQSVAINRGLLYYINRSRELIVFDNQSYQVVANGKEIGYNVMDIKYSQTLDRIVVCGSQHTTIVNPGTVELESRFHDSSFVGRQNVADYRDIATSEQGVYLIGTDDTRKMKVFPNIISWQATYTAPFVRTGRMVLSKMAWIDRIVLVRTSTTAPSPKLTAYLYTRDASVQTLAIDPGAATPNYKASGTEGHYYINAPCDSFMIELADATGGAGWTETQGIQYMRVFLRAEYDEQTPTA